MFSGNHWLHGRRVRLHFCCIFSPGLANNHLIRLLQGVRLHVVIGGDILNRMPPDWHLSPQLTATKVEWQWSSPVLQRRHIGVRVESQVASKDVVRAFVFLLDAFYERESCLLRVEGRLVKFETPVELSCA